MRAYLLPLTAFALLAALACRAPVATMSAKLQESMSPDEILAAMERGNERFVTGDLWPRDDLQDVRDTAEGQWPAAIILDCIDSRVSAHIIFDVGLGDTFETSVAGNVVDADVLGSIEYACAKAGSKIVLVLGHTGCGAVKGAVDGVELGNLTQLLAKLRPAIDGVPDDGSPRTSDNAAFLTRVAEANVRLGIARIRAESEVLARLEREGRIRIVGGLYDVATGEARWVQR